MIQITTTLASSWAAERSKQRARREKYANLAEQTQEKEDQARAQYEENTSYLFRSSAEKTRLAYEQARAALAAQQAKWAAHGLTGQSATVAEQTAQTQANAQRQAAQEQQTLQTAAAQEEKNYHTLVQKLRAAASAYRRAARHNSRWGSFTQALSTLLK